MTGPERNVDSKIAHVKGHLKIGKLGPGYFCCADSSSHGRGPKFEAVDLGVSSCYEIGRRVFAGAKALYVRNALPI